MESGSSHMSLSAPLWKQNLGSSSTNRHAWEFFVPKSWPSDRFMCTVSRIGKTRGNTSDPKASTKQQTAVGGGMQQCIEIIRERYLPNTGSSFCLSSLSLSLFLSLFQSLSLSSHIWFSISLCLLLHLSLYPSVLLYCAHSLCLFLCISVALKLYLAFPLASLTQSIWSIYIYLSFCPSLFCVSLSGLCISVCLALSPSVCLFVCLSSHSRMSFCPSVCLHLSFFPFCLCLYFGISLAFSI